MTKKIKNLNKAFFNKNMKKDDNFYIEFEVGNGVAAIGLFILGLVLGLILGWRFF